MNQILTAALNIIAIAVVAMCGATASADGSSYAEAKTDVGSAPHPSPSMMCRIGADHCIRLQPPSWLPAADVVVVEYVAKGTRYFITPNADEEAAMDAGGSWYRTGAYLFAWQSAHPGLVPVCRFFFGGSHLYTADASECAAVARINPSAYEGVGFYAEPTSACSGARVYRLYGYGGYRFTAEGSAVSAMVAGGWEYEGIAFCVARARP